MVTHLPNVRNWALADVRSIVASNVALWWTADVARGQGAATTLLCYGM